MIGGLLFGLTSELLKRWRPAREIDPIEANALHGGRMSLLGSIIVAAQTIWSSGVGESVGLEAGYTQLASGIASRIGRAFRLRRGDLRILVGCGAAAGIAGAFGAPLAGAFYGFELIIGSYSAVSLAPVGISALIGFLVAKSMAPADLGIVAPEMTTLGTSDLVLAAALGLLASAVGIFLMRGVALFETMLDRLRVRSGLRAMTGGLAVGLMAIASPQIMSSGHGALHLIGTLDLSLRTVAIVFALKIAASIVSLGAGFRGGLFFSSLLIGSQVPPPRRGFDLDPAHRLPRSQRRSRNRHERAGGLGHRRAVDDDLHRAGDHWRPLADDGGSHRRYHCRPGDA